MAPAEPSHKELSDTEKGTIIEEISTRAVIWDSTHANHSKRSVVDELFGQVAAFMTTSERKITAKVVKDCWKNLRTYFNSCKIKQQSATGLAEEDAPKKWKFFDAIAAFMITVPKFAEPEDRITNVIDEVDQSQQSSSEFMPSESQPSSSQVNIVDTPESSRTTVASSAPNTSSTVDKSQKTPRSAKKRRSNNSTDDELAQAIMESLSRDNSSALTPLGQTVSDLERKLDNKGFQRQKLALIRKIQNVIMETEEQILDL